MTLRQRLERAARDRVVQAALALIGVQIAFRAWATYGSWFVIDDFNFIARTGYDGLGLTSTAASYFGHVMPGAMYLSWVNHVAAPWDWDVPATELLLMQAGADLALLWLLITLFGRRPGILPPLALFLFSAITVEGGIWWAAAINLLPLEIALFMALASHVRYLRDDDARHLLAATAWIVGGLFFNEKTALVYIAVAVFTLTYFAEGHGLGRVRSAVRGRGLALSLYGLVGVVYVAGYLSVGREFGYANLFGYPTYEVVRNMVLHAYVPALTGGPIEWHRSATDQMSTAAPGDGVILLSVVVAGLVVNELLRHRVRAARAFALPIAFLVIDVVLVLLTRTTATGAGLVLDYRFQGEMAAVTAIALACAAMPVLGTAAGSAKRSDSELLDHPRRVAALVAAVSVLGVYSSVLYVQHWLSDHRAQVWVQTATATLDRADGDVALVDAPVPLFVTHGYHFPENLQSRVLARQAHADWTTVATDQLSMIDDRGRLVPATFEPVRHAVPGSVPGCGHQLTGGADPVTIPLDGAVAYGGWWVRIGYLSAKDTPVRVTTGGRSVATSLRSGVHALYFLGGDEFDSVTIAGLGTGAIVCTDDITVGRPEPLEANPS